VQKSLLTVEPVTDREPRYVMLETVREFALERLRESGELEPLQRRHILHFLELAETAEPELLGPEQARWYARLEQEHDNLREALRVCEEGGYVEPALRIATALWWFWFVRGHAAEARVRFTRLLERFAARGSDGPRAQRRAKALEAAGRLAAFQNDSAAARALQLEALRILEELDDRAGVFTVLQGLALAAEQEGDFGAARDHLERALAGARELGDALGIGTALCNLGPLLHAQGETAAARAMIQEALTLYEQAGNLRGQCHGWLSFGLLAYDETDYEAAREHVERALALYGRLADRRATAIPLASLARIAIAQGAYADAERHLRAALEIEGEVGDPAGIALALERWAELVALRGDAARAMTLAGAADALRAAAGAPLRPAEQARHEAQLQVANDALGADGARSARAHGAALADAGEAVAFALGAELHPDEPPSAPPAPVAVAAGAERQSAPASAAGSLSPREREVAALIAQGKTNRQIAAALVITEGTAANHVLHILTKLGFSSRAQIAAWATGATAPHGGARGRGDVPPA
jgi:non-specific serine/threonine protein kinase